jgi:predicted nucleic acid-binding Zn ribbon protein
VLYPVSVHFKGSGFYSTDYGKGGRKKTEPPKEGGSGDSGASEKKPDKDSGAGEKKAAAAD